MIFKHRFSHKVLRSTLILVIILCSIYGAGRLGIATRFTSREPDIIIPNTETKLQLYTDGRHNDIFFSLVRNSELKGMLQSINDLEKRFNSNFHYDWWFVNDEPFTEEFKEKTSRIVSGKSRYIIIPRQFWSYPDNIDQDRAAKSRKDMEKSKIAYGSSESYRFMCRFNSGLFYKLPELEHIEYYWRVEPNVKYQCDINYDVFKYMRDNGKLYGFTMALGEDKRTIPTLWEHTRKFFYDVHPEVLSRDNSLKFISDDNGETYNGCHFWSNFEIAHLKIYKDPQYGYESYFKYLDEQAGFFYERWGDAPVHTLAFSLLLNRSEIHFVPNTGYSHNPNQDCPPDKALREKLHCDCNTKKDFTWHRWSCVNKYFEVNDLQKPDSLKQVSEFYPYLLGNS